MLNFIHDAYHDKSGSLIVPESLGINKDLTNRREAAQLKAYRPQNRYSAEDRILQAEMFFHCSNSFTSYVQLVGTLWAVATVLIYWHGWEPNCDFASITIDIFTSLPSSTKKSRFCSLESLRGSPPQQNLTINMPDTVSHSHWSSHCPFNLWLKGIFPKSVGKLFVYLLWLWMRICKWRYVNS